MRIARALLFTFTLLSTTAFAQGFFFEQVAFLRIPESTMSVRGAAMGNVSIDDPSLNPVADASLKTFRFSIAGARSSYDVYDTVRTPQGVFYQELVTREPSALSQVALAIPFGDFVISGHYRAEPEITGTQPLTVAGTATYQPPACPEWVQSPCGYQSFFPPSSAFEYRDRRYGASVAWERGKIALGAGAEMRDIYARADSRSSRFATSPEQMMFDDIATSISSRSIVPSAGIRWRVTPHIDVAAAYNGGSEYERRSDACQSGADWRCVSEFVTLEESTQRSPDAYRASLTMRPDNRLTVVVEAVRRNYGDIGVQMVPQPEAPLGYPYRDVTNLHAGAEYRISKVAVRAGWWRDRTASLASSYLSGSDHDHVTIGGGVHVGQARFDIAFDDVNAPATRRASFGVTVGLPNP